MISGNTITGSSSISFRPGTEDLLAAVDAVVSAPLAYLDKRCPETFEAMVVAGHKLREAREAHAKS